MEMCYDGTLVMPDNYAVVSEDEMTYVDGGMFIIPSNSASTTTTTKVSVTLSASQCNELATIMSIGGGVASAASVAATFVSTLVGGPVAGAIVGTLAGFTSAELTVLSGFLWLGSANNGMILDMYMCGNQPSCWIPVILY